MLADAVCKAKLLNDFLFFTRYFFKAQYGRRFIVAGHHVQIAKALTRVVRGETKRLIINIPPRFGKTEVAVKMFVAWCMANSPGSKFIHLSYSDDLALDNSSAIRDVVKSPEFQRFFPTALRADSDSKKKWWLDAGGGLYATSTGGPITGFGAGAMGRVRAGTGSPADGFAGCFPYDEVVRTENGLVKIGDIVTNRMNVRVWSRNLSTGLDELGEIKTFWTNPKNRIVEVGLSDGAVFRCTPDHEIMTTGGWVEAKDLTCDHTILIPDARLSDVLELVDGNPKPFAKSFARDALVFARIYQFLGGFGPVVPLWVGEILCNARPCFPHLDLPDNTFSDAVASLQFCDRRGAGEYLNDLLFTQFGSGSALKQWECPVLDGILHIVGLGSVGEVCEPVIKAVTIEVPDFFALGLRPDECLNNKLVNEPEFNNATLGEPNSKPPICGFLWFENLSGECVWTAFAWHDGSIGALDVSCVADRVKPIIPIDRKPLFVRDVGHADVTYCLEIRRNHNFYVSSRQVLVSNCLIIDDPIKPDDAFSDTMRDRINRRFNNTFMSRLNSQDTPIVVIMQRLHENDMTGYLLGGGSGEKWEHLCLTAITDDGESLWPEKLDIATLRQMENADPYTFAGQYQQRPSPLSGGILKPDNIQIIEALPVGPIEWVRGWDFASTTTGDWTVGAKLGRLPDGRIIIGDIVRVRVGPDERDAALVNATARDGHDCKVSIPQDPGQAGVTQVKYLLRQLSGYSVKASPESGNKVVRCEPFASQVNVGNVLMLKAEWNVVLINEMRMFPNGTWDDQVDACSRAFAHLIGRNPGEIFIPDMSIKDVIAGNGTCGKCTAFENGMCGENFGLQVNAADVGCTMFIALQS